MQNCHDHISAMMRKLSSLSSFEGTVERANVIRHGFLESLWFFYILVEFTIKYSRTGHRHLPPKLLPMLVRNDLAALMRDLHIVAMEIFVREP